jgi:hypothetical protein
MNTFAHRLADCQIIGIAYIDERGSGPYLFGPDVPFLNNRNSPIITFGPGIRDRM